MTDKQIIIDGVPVQDCCYFDYENDGYEDSCYIHQNECSAQNCYYKQLKRKEQECNKLKKTLAEIKEICNSVENIENINSLYDAKLSGMYLQANKILQKINECEVEDAR